MVDGDWNVSKYSGLFSYNVSTSKWKLLQYVLLQLFFLSRIMLLTTMVFRQSMAETSTSTYQYIPPRFGKHLLRCWNYFFFC